MDNAKKKRIKQYVSWICIVAIVALLAVMPLLAQKEAEEDGPVASILEATVQTGEIDAALLGGGTLVAGNAMDVKLPTGVKITEFLVKNGDTVAEGDPVAEVDKISVMTAIVQVRETLEYIQDEMIDARDDKAASTISATTGGKVKAVYAKAGDSVQDVMLEHGALAVLSMDGLMAVDLKIKTNLASGDTVYVTFADGTEVSGRVDSNLDGKLVITVEDENYDIGTPVTVTNAEDKTLGRGTLYAHNAWKATAFTGTVSTVYAKLNTEVHSGSTLFTLKDTDFTGTLESLGSLHRDYEELLQDLFTMYETGVITAPCDGLISGVDTDSEFLLAAIQGEQGWFVDLLDNPVEETGWTVMLLSNVEDICTGDETCQAKKHENGCPMKCTGREGCQAVDHDPGCAVFCTMLPDCANQNHKTGCLGVCTGDGNTCQSTRIHQYHLKSCFKRCISDVDENPDTTCDADVHNAACIENCTKSEDCTALTHKEGCWFHGVTYTAVAVQVKMVALEGLQVVMGNTTYQVAPDGTGWKLVAPDALKDVFVGQPQLLAVDDPSQYAEGDILLIITGTNSAGQTVYQSTALYQKGDSQTPGGFPNGMGGFGGFGGMAGFGGMGAMGAMGGTSTGFEFFDLEGSVLMTVTEQEVMTLNITLDEHDINKVALGQTAEVKITPLKGRTFEATVTDIGTEGTNNGGSSKFTVELTLKLEQDMLAGMSATASLPLYTKQDVLTIPVAALVEQREKTVVYTALDPETGELTGAVEVTTGVSDGIIVEILSGLSAGDEIRYSYYDTLELSTEVESGSSFGF